jgi:hypothetical protein
MRQLDIKIDTEDLKNKLGLKDVDITPIIDSISMVEKAINNKEFKEKDSKTIEKLLKELVKKETPTNKDVVNAINDLGKLLSVKDIELDYTEKFDTLIKKISDIGLFRPSYNSYDPKLRDSEGNHINPATKEKQDEIITAIEAISDSTNYKTILDNYSTSNIIYVGDADIGSATSSAVWRIQKIDKTTGIVITWADGDDFFNNIWDNRLSLTYS